MPEYVETVFKVAGPVRVARVNSKSRPGKQHKVTVACECEGFRYNGYCRHVALAARDLKDTASLVRNLHRSQRETSL